MGKSKLLCRLQSETHYKFLRTRREKTGLRGFRPGATTGEGYRLENSEIGRKGIALCSENKGADQLCG